MYSFSEYIASLCEQELVVDTAEFLEALTECDLDESAILSLEEETLEEEKKQIRIQVGKDQFKTVYVDDSGKIYSRDPRFNGKKVNLQKLRQKMLKKRGVKKLATAEKNAQEKAIEKEAKRIEKADLHQKTAGYAKYIEGNLKRDDAEHSRSNDKITKAIAKENIKNNLKSVDSVEDEAKKDLEYDKSRGMYSSKMLAKKHLEMKKSAKPFVRLRAYKLDKRRGTKEDADKAVKSLKKTASEISKKYKDE